RDRRCDVCSSDLGGRLELHESPSGSRAGWSVFVRSNRSKVESIPLNPESGAAAPPRATPASMRCYRCCEHCARTTPRPRRTMTALTTPTRADEVHDDLGLGARRRRASAWTLGLLALLVVSVIVSVGS